MHDNITNSIIYNFVKIYEYILAFISKKIYNLRLYKHIIILSLLFFFIRLP